MDTMRERVALPDPESQRLVHPLDLAEARGSYRTAWLLSLVGSAEFLVLLAALAWAATAGYFAPVAAVVGTGLVAEVARRHHLSQAWAHVPRRRQDTDRPDPWGWEVVRALTMPLSMVAGVVLGLATMSHQRLDEGVRAWSVGAALGLGAALVLARAASWWSHRTAAAGVAAVCALVTVLAGAVAAWAGGWAPAGADPLTVVLGALVLLAAYGAWWWTRRLR